MTAIRDPFLNEMKRHKSVQIPVSEERGRERESFTARDYLLHCVI
jgi:hypothetical protein